jgi:hypothetical protein
MRGVTEMKVTHEQMMKIIELWLRTELLQGYGAKNHIPIPTSVTQNTQTKEFIIKFIDAPVTSNAA